jgi:hypothetical protein
MALLSPPSDFQARKLRLTSCPKVVIRLSKKKHPDPVFWSKQGRFRLDSPTADFGVLYTAQDLKTAILEVWGDAWSVNRFLSISEIEAYRACTLAINPRAKLADCTGAQLNLLGTDSGFFASLEYPITQEWARAIMAHPQKPEGIYYHSRKNPQLFNYAFFGRPDTIPKVTVKNEVDLVNYPDLFDLLDELKVDLIVGNY